jgi:molybdopterin-guanine dinucleotide biosynthesis protein A
MLGGQRLIDRMVFWANQQTDAIALAVRDGNEDWGTGLPLLYDRYDHIGPISALASALHEAQRMARKTVLLIGCDLPFLPDDLIPRLSAVLAENGVSMPLSQGRLHPMAALWRTEPARLDQWIQQGGQSMWRYARDIGMADVLWTETHDPFTNINDLDALARAEQQFKTRYS